MRLLALLEDKRKSGAIWYEIIRQSPKDIVISLILFIGRDEENQGGSERIKVFRGVRMRRHFRSRSAIALQGKRKRAHSITQKAASKRCGQSIQATGGFRSFL
jgi:hypothetical protein